MSLEDEEINMKFEDKKIYHKTFKFETTCTKELEEDGAKYGIIEGYASTFGNKDRQNDIIENGAFKKSIARHKKDDARPIRMFFQHDYDMAIGGFPISSVKEDDKGLFVRGEINLEVQKGREVYALAKQGIISDMSIGFSINAGGYEFNEKENTTIIKEAELWEISLVAEPANADAKITNVKSINEFTKMGDIENFLKTSCSLSGSQRKLLISKIKEFSSQRDAETDNSSERDATEQQEKIDADNSAAEISAKLDKLVELSNNF